MINMFIVAACASFDFTFREKFFMLDEYLSYWFPPISRRL